MINQALRFELIDMAEEDRKVRNELASSGKLFDGYPYKMRSVHEFNAEQLMEIVNERGWPGKTLVGEDGGAAAWLIAQHAISLPDYQRTFLAHLKKAVESGEALKLQEALLTDRIRFCEGKPQLYGTQYDWDDNGELNPWTVEDMERVDELRESIGLSSLEENTERIRRQAQAEGEKTPENLIARKKEMEEFYKRVGWRI